VYRRGWRSRGMFSVRMVITIGGFAGSSVIILILVNWTVSQTQSPTYPMLGLYSTKSAECWPGTASSLWAILTGKDLVSSSQSKAT
jgi:hypothetical protein